MRCSTSAALSERGYIAARRRSSERSSVAELLAQYPLVQRMVGVVQQHEGGLVIGLDLDVRYAPDFEMVGRRRDGTFFGFSDFEPEVRTIGKQSAAPTTRPEGGNRRQRHQRRARGPQPGPG